MADETLVTLTADIVSSHVGHNAVSVEDMPGLISSVYGALAKLGQADEAEPEKQEPAVSIRSSVKPDVLTCLVCGAKMKMLKRHIATEHGLTPAQYRQAWNLPSDYPMVAPNYAAHRKELAVKIGLGRKPKAQTTAQGSDVVQGSDAPTDNPTAKPKRAYRKKATTTDA